MNKKDCMMLKILDEKRSMTEVAKKLYISQPALTYRLQQLEQNMNTQIFIREKPGLTPTPQGEVIIDYARHNLEQFESTLEKIELMGTEVKGTIKLGVASTYGQYILPNLLNQFKDKHPNVNFKITTGLSSMIFDMFKRGDLHIGILRGNFLWNEEKELLATEPICVVSKKPLAMNELPYLPRIEYEMDSYLKNIIDFWWDKTFAKERIVSMSVDSLETAKELVRTGLGYTILPGICLTREEELWIKPIKNFQNEVVERLTWSYCRKNTLKFKAISEFYNFLKLNSSY